MCGRKRCTSNRENSLMRIVKKIWFKNLGELHKEWTEAGVKASRATTYRRVKEFGYGCRQRRLTWAKEKKNWTGLDWLGGSPSGPKSSFQMRAGFVFYLEAKVLESGGMVEKLIAKVAWSPVLSFHSKWWFGVQCHLLVLVHCVFFKTNVTAPVYQFWSTSCFLLLTSFLKMLISFFSWICHLPTLPKAPKVGVLDWPANSPDLNPIENLCQEENEKQETKKCRWAEGHGQRNLGFHTTSAVPQTDHLHATPNRGIN